MRPNPNVTPFAACVAVGTALLAWFLARLALYAAWGLPLLGPGTVVLALLVLAGLWATVETPRLARGGGARVAAWLGAAALLGAGQAVIYYRVEAKDDVAGLGFSLLAGGALLLWPRMRRAVSATVLAGIALMAVSALWMRVLQPHVPWDLYAGPWSGQAPTLLFWAGWLACLGGLAQAASQARPSLGPARPLARGAELAFLALVLAIAAALRFYKAAQIPQGYWSDEVNLARVIRERVLLEHSAPIYVGEQVVNPGAYLWVGGALFTVFGQGVDVLRVTAGVFGLLALLPFWGLARIWVGQRWALAATLCFGVMRWAVIPERIAFMSSFALFWMLAAFWALWSALVRPGRGIWPWLLAGLLLGANLHTYIPARAVPPLVVVFLGLQAWLDPAWRRPLRAWLALAGGFLLSAGPMLWYIATNLQDYLQRSAVVSIFADVAKTGQPLLPAVGANLARHLLMFTYRGDFNARHNLHFYPQADFMLAAVLALALPWVLGRAWRDARGRFLCLWIGVMLAAGVLSLPIEAPQGNRCILVTPALALAAAWALRELSATLAGAFEGGWPETVRALGLALLLGVAGLNAWELLVVWPNDEATWEHFSPRASAVMERIRASGPGTAVYVSELKDEYQYYGYEWGLFARYELETQGRGCNTLWLSQNVPAQDHGVPVRDYLLIWAQSDKEIDARFRDQFPDIAVERAAAPFKVAGLPDLMYSAAVVPVDRVPADAAGAPHPFLYRNAD